MNNVEIDRVSEFDFLGVGLIVDEHITWKRTLSDHVVLEYFKKTIIKSIMTKKLPLNKINKKCIYLNLFILYLCNIYTERAIHRSECSNALHIVK